jgi:ATP-dependent Clp protease adaptor protein ClpS
MGARAGGTPPSPHLGNEDNNKRRTPGAPGTAVITKTKPQTKRPNLYRVLLLNDDYTPMEFVVVVLQKFFGMTRERATQVMLKVHREGIGICGVYPRDVATTKVQQVAAYSRKHQHPLQCVMEET